MASFADRVVGAMRLRVATYEEVEHDVTATSEAAAVVALASVASGIGGYWLLGIVGIARGALIALIGWVIGAVVLWLIGTKIIPGKQTEADIGQLLRTVGFAGAPGLLRILGVVPGLGLVSSIVAGVWTLIATVVAVRVALDYDDNVKAIIACLIALVVYFIVGALLASLLVWF
jgi:Yip1 domain